jgi:O-antigen/teichoic acid export membrane protein
VSDKTSSNARWTLVRARLGRLGLMSKLRSQLFGSMSIITVAMAVRLVLQIIVFGIVAGSMGASQFGGFASVAALAAIFGSFSGWGADQLLLRRVGRKREELPMAMATSLVFVALSAPLLVVLALVFVPLAVDSSIPWQLVLFITVSDIGFARVNGIGGSCYQAVGRPMGTLRLTVGFAMVRVMTALLWVTVSPRHDALSWSHYYFAISMLAAVVSIWLVRRDLGPPRWQIAWHEWKDGFHFALQTASQTVFGSVDKPVVAALSDLSVAGLYAAASRIAVAAGIPVNALLFSAYVRFFQVGAAGPRASARLAVRLLPVGVGLGALGTVATLVLAPLAPRILGSSYIGTDAALLLLAPLPIFRAVHSLGLDVLVSSGHTGLRTIAQIAMPPLNILFCWLLVPSHGAIGAALAALLTNISLALATWAIVGALVRQQSMNGQVSLETGDAANRPLAG